MKKRKNTSEIRVGRYQLVGGPFHGQMIDMDKRASGTVIVTPDDWYLSYEKVSNTEDHFPRTAHATELEFPDFTWDKTSPDECSCCGNPQLGRGSEICFYPLEDEPEFEVAFRICRLCLRRLSASPGEFKKFEDGLREQAVEMAASRIAKSN